MTILILKSHDAGFSIRDHRHVNGCWCLHVAHLIICLGGGERGDAACQAESRINKRSWMVSI